MWILARIDMLLIGCLIFEKSSIDKVYLTTEHGYLVANGDFTVNAENKHVITSREG